MKMLKNVNDNIFDVLMHIEDMVWCINVDNLDIVYGNDSFKKIFDDSGSDGRGNIAFFKKIIHKDDCYLFDEAINEVIENGLASCKIRIINGLSIEKTIKVELFLSKNESDEPETILAIGIEYKPDEFKSLQHVNNFSILDNIRDVFFILDNNGNFIFANTAFEKFLQLSRNDIYGKNIWDVIPEAKGLLFEENYYRSAKENLSLSFEEFLPSACKWLSVLTYPSEIGMSVFLHDITKLKKNSELLIESEKKFHLMSDNSPMFIWTFDEHLKPTFYNKTFINFSGISFTDLLSNGWMNLIIADETESIAKIWQQGFTHKEEMNFECRLKRHDGAFRWIKINGTPQIDTSGFFSGFLVTGVDITNVKFYYEKLEEKNKELELALNESHRLSSILNKTSNILVLTDVEGKITWVNEAFTKLKEYSLDEVIGKKPGPLVYGKETSLETINILHEGIQKREITRVEILNYTKSGNKLWVDLRIEPIFKNGVPEGYMAIEIDITKRKKDELAIKERNEKIKEFSFITSHDLRHEFAKVMMLLNLAKSQENSVEDYKTLFMHLEAPVNKINSIISKINTNLYLGEASKNIDERLNEMEEIREICLVDDDELTNMIHRQIIKIILPQTPILIFDSVEAAIKYFKDQPNNNRLIFLDLVFQNDKSGWDFLEEYEQIELSAPVIILSSSIDNEDLEKSKHYKSVLEYFVKPLTAETLHKYIKKKH